MFSFDAVANSFGAGTGTMGFGTLMYKRPKHSLLAGT